VHTVFVLVLLVCYGCFILVCVFVPVFFVLFCFSVFESVC